MRRCPRYAGNVYHDALEDQLACLQCGWRAYPPPLPATQGTEPQQRAQRQISRRLKRKQASE